MCKYTFKCLLSILLDMCVEVRLLTHVVTAFLISGRPAAVPSTAATLPPLPPAGHPAPVSPRPWRYWLLSRLFVLLAFIGPPDACEVVARCGLICVSLMIIDVEPLSKCVWAIFYLFFGEIAIQVFPNFKIGSLVLLWFLLSCKNSSHILGSNSLSDM